eukprot:ctg_227.g125
MFPVAGVSGAPRVRLRHAVPAGAREDVRAQRAQSHRRSAPSDELLDVRTNACKVHRGHREQRVTGAAAVASSRTRLTPERQPKPCPHLRFARLPLCFLGGPRPCIRQMANLRRKRSCFSVMPYRQYGLASMRSGYHDAIRGPVYGACRNLRPERPPTKLLPSIVPNTSCARSAKRSPVAGAYPSAMRRSWSASLSGALPPPPDEKLVQHRRHAHRHSWMDCMSVG